MTISYEIILTIVNLTDDSTYTFNKDFDYEITSDNIYNNHHLIADSVSMFALFKTEINDYCDSHSISINNVDIDEFNINSKTDRVDVYFEPGDGDDPNQISLNPNISCYVYPQYDALETPILNGEAYDNHTIIWSWENDGLAHYLVEEAIDISDIQNQDKIVAEIPIGTYSYVETNLESDTHYTRRLISFNDHQTSGPSRPVTIKTATAPIDKSLEQYEIEKNYDYTADDSERNIIDERLEAFHSGVGDYNDLKVYKQMDADFYQKFKTYIQIRGSRTQRERRYDSVGFNYKVCLEADEEIEESEGEVTFDVHVFPKEKVTIKEYLYATKPVKVKARMSCWALLKKENENDDTVTCPLKEPEWEKKTRKVPNEPNEWIEDDPEPFDGKITVILSFDISSSMTNTNNGKTRWQMTKEAALQLIDNIEAYSKDGVALAGKVQYALTFWGREGQTRISNTANDAKSVINSVYFNGDHAGIVGAYGNWQPTNLTAHNIGLTNWIGTPGITNAKVMLFFTDGFANNTGADKTCTYHNYASEPTAYGSGGKFNQIYSSITNSYYKLKTEQGIECYTLFGADYNTDCDNDYIDIWNMPANKWGVRMRDHMISHDKQIYELHYQNANGIDKVAYSAYTSSTILNAMWNGLKRLIDGLKPSEGESSGHYEWPLGTPTDKKFHDKDGNPTDEEFSEESDGWEFKGWKDAPDDKKIELPVSYDIDDTKWAKIVIPPEDQDPWEIEIGGEQNPITVIYARNEQRAIIPPDAIIEDKNFDKECDIKKEAIKVDPKDIQTLIEEAIPNTPEYQEGYTTLVEAFTAEEKKQGNYIIRGLFIKDSLQYADDDIVDVNLDDPSLKDGYDGSINVYAEINKLGTAFLGDDVYAVGKDKYVWLSGYTDAIIYETEIVRTTELNAAGKYTQSLLPAPDYPDIQEQIIIPKDLEPETKLYNRKNKDYEYDGETEDIKHVVQIINKDKDIYITGANYLKKAGDWVLFVPEGTDISDTNSLIRGDYPIIEFLTEDIKAHNDEHYYSPILNYRFNFEDPDAYTGYYELLDSKNNPTFDKFSPYQNIVIIHIYYAKNIYIQDEEGVGSKVKYIESFPLNATEEDKLATTASVYYDLKAGQTYFRDEYVTDYLWFKAKEHHKRVRYYDEKPNQGMDSFYGNVNGRYREDNQSGKKDLRVSTPAFNLPTSLIMDTVKIYIMITEFYPKSALVSYKWENPYIDPVYGTKDSITKRNGDYVTFSSDSLTVKDIKYNELLQTITSTPMEVFDNKTNAKGFTLKKPISDKQYDHYYIELFSDNSDVLALNYPSEVIFDENDNAEFYANFKGVVNATTKWSPRIHNGYYYLNQHEYYAYSEFDVDADFEEYSEENYKVINGYLVIDVNILRRAGELERYQIIKSARSELIQNEKEFVWDTENSALTILPVIDGQYYKEYTARIYESPIILFPNTLTSADRLKVEFLFTDGSEELPPMQVRSYDIENGQWSEWIDFINNTVPTAPLSCAYQVKFELAATVINSEKTIDDYLCCYLDWKDDGDEINQTNIVTITDHLQAGPYQSEGIFNSKIIDYGCESEITFDMFSSDMFHECILYVACENYTRDRLLLENVKWTKVNGSITLTGRYFRYRVVVPYGEKVYWVHKKVNTKQSTVMLPYVLSIEMSGEYQPRETKDSFQEIQSFEITTDGKQHRIFSSVYDLISGDIHTKGYTDNEIQFVKLSCTANNIQLHYDHAMENEFPALSLLNTDVKATADFETEISTQYTPYIYSTADPVTSYDCIQINRGTPQQYSPITVEDIDGNTYKEIFDVDEQTLQKTETIEILSEDDRRYIKLSRNDFDIKTLTVFLNNETDIFTDYRIVNNLMIFNNLLNINDLLTIKYNVLHSFYTEIDYDNDKTKITIYSDYDSEQAKIDELQNIEPITEHGIYTECKLSQIYANGLKVIFNNDLIKSDLNWKYDANLQSLYYCDNYDNISMIVNDLFPTNNYEMEIVAYSNDMDNDVIGFVVGYTKDSANTPHAITYLVSLGKSYLFDGNNTALVLDYGKNTAVVLASKNIEHQDYNFWSEMPNGIKFSIKKISNIITCQISNWNDIENMNNDSILTYDTDSSNDTQIFTGAVYYGFCTRSQKDTYFIAPNFAGRITKQLTVEEQLANLKHKYKVYFETNKTSNKFIAKNLSLNPVYRTDYKGFIYLTDDHNEPYTINIYRNPKYIKAGGYDKIDVAVECLDYEGNPVISKDIQIDCQYGILTFDNNNSKHLTDINGVVHALYESSVLPCTDIITARTITTNGIVVEKTIEIISE